MCSPFESEVEPERYLINQTASPYETPSKSPGTFRKTDDESKYPRMHGTVLKVSCNKGFKSDLDDKTEETTTCLNGQWTPREMGCFRDCEDSPIRLDGLMAEEDPENPSRSMTRLHGDTRVLRCALHPGEVAEQAFEWKLGYTDSFGRSSEKTACMDGQWTHVTLDCKCTCPDFIADPLVDPLHSSYSDPLSAAQAFAESISIVVSDETARLEGDWRRVALRRQNEMLETGLDLDLRQQLLTFPHDQRVFVEVSEDGGIFAPAETTQPSSFLSKKTKSKRDKASNQDGSDVPLALTPLPGREFPPEFGVVLSPITHPLIWGSFFGTSTCINGAWTPIEAQCKKMCHTKQFPRPAKPEHIDRLFFEPNPFDFSFFHHGSSAKVGCKPGTDMSPPQIRPSDPPLSLARASKGMESEERSAAEDSDLASSQSSMPVHASRIEFFVWCNEGEFTALPFTDCLARCPPYQNQQPHSQTVEHPDESEWDEVSGTYAHRSKAVLRCKKGSFSASALEGADTAWSEEETLTCEDGQWTEQTLRCRAQCPLPPLAFAGYILEEPSAPSIEDIEQMAKLGTGASPEFGEEESEEERRMKLYRPETFLTVRCNETAGFFTLSRFQAQNEITNLEDIEEEDPKAQHETIMCTDGAFQAIQTSCRRPCLPLGFFFEELHLDYGRYVVTSTEVYHSVKVGISCAPGYQPISGRSPDSTTCLNGTWSLFSVRCELTCDPFREAMQKRDPDLFGKISLFGEVLHPFILMGNVEADAPGTRLGVTCNEGFVPIFQSTIDFEFLECVGGSWTERTLKCERPCRESYNPPEPLFDHKIDFSPPYRVLAGPHGNDLPVPPRSYVVIRCSDGWGSVTDSISRERIYCTDGHWEIQTLICEVFCPAPSYPSTSRYSVSRFSRYGVGNAAQEGSNQDDHRGDLTLTTTNFYPPSTVAFLTCRGDFTPYPLENDGKLEIICRGGSFGAPNFACMKSCPDPPRLPPRARMFFNFDRGDNFIDFEDFKKVYPYRAEALHYHGAEYQIGCFVHNMGKHAQARKQHSRFTWGQYTHRIYPWFPESFDMKNILLMFTLLPLIMCAFAVYTYRTKMIATYGFDMWQAAGTYLFFLYSCAAAFFIFYIWMTFVVWSPTLSTSLVETYGYMCLSCDQDINPRPRAQFGDSTRHFVEHGRSWFWSKYIKPASHTGSKLMKHPRSIMGLTKRVMCVDGEWTDSSFSCTRAYSRTSDFNTKQKTSVICTVAFQKGFLDEKVYARDERFGSRHIHSSLQK
eukprot:Cvel_29005.t1-p1 / transcript=Cvel_29005.t1 / gene=Cvel_29005 / organism=Chromera_velia_CCMP2878 / gene_product=hypothetical protein / transcript_product=hypothetical protein / location=Cvel_scaffold3905:225-12080(+) / protein_length=1263 / sequence_SO=supercontig / SO=protein_coding / is_pseudo=false